MTTTRRPTYPPIVRALLDDDAMTRVDPRILRELGLLARALREACRYDPRVPQARRAPARRAPVRRAA